MLNGTARTVPQPFASSPEAIFIAAGLFVLYGSWVNPRANPNLRILLSDLRPGSADFFSTVGLGVFALALVIVLLGWGVRCFLPFGERLHCDRSLLTWSKIPWIGFGNRWVTRTVPPSEISHAHYGLAYRKRGGDLYGVLLEVGGKRWKLFAGIDSPEANRILNGLKGLGVNVPHDPGMRESIRETLRDRRAQL
jgi:hypothetical protein